MINRARSRTRACGEHAFRVIKQLWGFTKVRYRGLAKNLARAQTMFALANLYQSAPPTAPGHRKVRPVTSIDHSATSATRLLLTEYPSKRRHFRLIIADSSV